MLGSKLFSFINMSTSLKKKEVAIKSSYTIYIPCAEASTYELILVYLKKKLKIQFTSYSEK